MNKNNENRSTFGLQPKTTGKMILCLCVAALSASAGSISRKADFILNVDLETRGNSHGSAVNTIGAQWSYFFVPNYFQYYRAEAKSLDYETLLAEDKLLPIPCSNMAFGQEERNPHDRGQVFARYHVSSDNVMLYWNRYGEAHGKLGSGAIVMKFVVPESGVYSLQGPLAALSNQQQTVKDAILTIGTQEQSKDSFTARLVRTLDQEILSGEARQIELLENIDALQGMELSAGDRIVFVYGSASRNHNGITFIDSDLRIESEALPPAQAVSDASVLLSRLDFSSPALEEVKKAWDAGDMDAAIDSYKSVLAERVIKLPALKGVGYWLYGHAQADQLLEGILTTGHYGAPGTTTYTIGKPGSVGWFKVPEDGYDVILRDITTMHWTNKLAEAYAKTGDKRYADAYLGYWSDFTTNWYPRFHENMRDPEFRGLINGSIQWALRSRLYNAWRMGVLAQGLRLILGRGAMHDTLGDIDNEPLATVLRHLYEREFPAAMRFLEAGGGVPNQQAHLAHAMFFHGAFLHDMKGASAWQSASLNSAMNDGGYLPDGTDMEQSFNYNKGLPGALHSYITLSEALLSGEEPAWFGELRRRYTYRVYFMQSIVMPVSGQPISGKNNTWAEYDREEKFLPHLDSNLPLTAKIKDRFYGDNTMGEPAFRSIYFPYGGYVALRSDWTRDALYAFMKNSRPGRGHMQNENNAVAFGALGRQLLINSSHNAYSPDPTWKGYGSSSISCNSIAVDGYGNVLYLEAAQTPPSYTNPLGYRFLDGKHFSFAEGVYDRLYAGSNFLDPELTDQNIIRDVRHQRQLILLREEKIMIVTDVVHSESERRFTQTWNFPPDFKPDEVLGNDGTILTSRPDDVNLAMYQFMGGTDGRIEYEKYYGLNEDGRILGWVGLGDKTTGLEMTPAVDMHCSWRSQGEKVLITVVVPFTTVNPVESIKQVEQGKARGVVITLAGGKTVEYLYGGEAAEAVLKTASATLELQPDGGFEQDANGVKQPIVVATGFHWEETANGEMPVYTPKPKP